MTTPLVPPTISPDGNYEWDGQQWQPRQQVLPPPAPPKKKGHGRRNAVIGMGLAVILFTGLIVAVRSGGGSPTGAPSTTAGQVLLQASGSGNAETATFTAPTKYTITYSFNNGDFPGAVNFAIMAVDQNGQPRLGQPSINRLATSGNGTATVTDVSTNPGTHLQILTEGNWSVKVTSAS